MEKIMLELIDRALNDDFKIDDYVTLNLEGNTIKLEFYSEGFKRDLLASMKKITELKTK